MRTELEHIELLAKMRSCNVEHIAQAFAPFSSVFRGEYERRYNALTITDFGAEYVRENGPYWLVEFGRGSQSTQAQRAAVAEQFDEQRECVAFEAAKKAMSYAIAEHLVLERVAEIEKTPAGEYEWRSMFHLLCDFELSFLAKKVRDRIAPRTMTKKHTNTGIGI